MSDKFRVFFYNSDDTIQEETLEPVEAEEAVRKAQRLITSIPAKIGSIKKVTIISPDDTCTFEWVYGKGIVFPPPPTPQGDGYGTKLPELLQKPATEPVKKEQLVRPMRGVVYTSLQVYRELYLKDSPCLLVQHNGLEAAVQDSHVDDLDKMLSNEHFAKLQWRYAYTTDEWIPVFHHVPQQGEDLTKALDFKEFMEHGKKALWVTPVGWPREPNDGYVDGSDRY